MFHRKSFAWQRWSPVTQLKKKGAPHRPLPTQNFPLFLFVSWSAAQRMTITFKMATETSTSATNQSKNVLIGVTGSVASIKLSKLVEELLLLPSKVLIISYRNRVKFKAWQCQTILILQVKHAFFLFLAKYPSHRYRLLNPFLWWEQNSCKSFQG